MRVCAYVCVCMWGTQTDDNRVLRQLAIYANLPHCNVQINKDEMWQQKHCNECVKLRDGNEDDSGGKTVE